MSIGYTLALTFILLTIVSIFDYLLRAFWSPFYIRFGLPVSVLHFPLSRRFLFWELIPDMESQPISSSFYPTAVFKRISETELAFRNKLLEYKIGFRLRFPYHGVVRLDAHSGVVTITGFIPWYAPFAMVWSFCFFKYIVDNQDFIDDFFMFWMVLILVVNLVAQVFVMRHIGKRISDSFSNGAK